MTDPIFQTMSPEEATALLTEALRRELACILFEQDRGPARSDGEIDALIELLEQEKLTLKRRARRGGLHGRGGAAARRGRGDWSNLARDDPRYRQLL
ncbi:MULTISPECIES: hypothetical protein [unclassified Sulfitobacter]|uniref:hypothetical protein n=1 Tax=unclassified Sulfitobacter TaxID=196795 RepID=UPI000832041B